MSRFTPYFTMMKTSLLPLFYVLTIPSSHADDEIIIDEITITAPAGRYRALQHQNTISKQMIAAKKPTSFTSILQSLPGVGIRTNSRGEAVLRLRGSEERQSQVFLDGAPITIPWDGRADLNLIPSIIIDKISIIKSASPIEFGAGAILGVVDITTLRPDAEISKNFRIEAGSLGHILIEGSALLPMGDTSLSLAVNYRRRDAETVASPAPIPFDPLNKKGRTNTGLTHKNIFISLEHEETWGTLRASLLHVEAQKNIAAAGHIDPLVGKVRFWQYPSQNYSQFTVNAEIDLSDDTTLKTTAWYQYFTQKIESYKDISYQEIKKTQNDKDKTFGIRLVSNTDFEDFTLRLVNSYQHSQHEQSFNSNPETEVFSQSLFSLGAEIDIPLTEKMKLSVASAYDKTSMPLTGGRAPQDSLSSWAASLSFDWQIKEGLFFKTSAGQRTRFPSMRETYGTALGQFILNPHLKPETIFSFDISLKYVPSDQVNFTITPWYNRIKHSLSRRTIFKNNQKFRQRYNLKGSSGFGLEAKVDWTPNEKLDFTAQMAWQSLTAFKDHQGARPILYQRPNLQGLIAANFKVTSSFTLRAEINYIGQAKDENEQGQIVDLGTSTEFNIINRYHFSDRLEIYLTIDNITNSIILPQLGLPRQGRKFSAGLQLKF